MLPETYLAQHHAHAAELRAEADAHRLAAEARGPVVAGARRPHGLRVSVGWALVTVGLRLAGAPRVAPAP
ncbi:hypothetical protein SGFS_048550 [Streptomyces graminofaciens]|uniref:Uncharacterized protein n=1 Tax=Streptomyces graminofaciens TaxID=68212 RepID=A0ABM9SBX7_9ACTN|nr:hypothetical protein [Streptomyces graminofaciens]BBC33561.1 hypothetical protein SGFS_048550 [Streptomyces graminofaciens]